MLLKGVIEFPKVPNYQSRTRKLLLLNNGLFTANVLSAMILSDTNVSRPCYRTGPAYRVPPPPPRSPDLTPCDFFSLGFCERKRIYYPACIISKFERRP